MRVSIEIKGHCDCQIICPWKYPTFPCGEEPKTFKATSIQNLSNYGVYEKKINVDSYESIIVILFE